MAGSGAMSGEGVARGPALRPASTPELLDTIHRRYGIGGGEARDLGGSSNLNLLLADGRRRYVVRVYRPWVVPARLEAMQLVRGRIAQGGVPSALPIPARDGEPWITVGGRLVEVEPYVAHDAQMDTWERLEAGLPLLGRIHTLLQPLDVGEAGRRAPASNNIEPEDALPGTLRGIQRLRRWGPSPAELELAAASEDLARLVDRAERDLERLPRQVVHGDYWDNNVLFREGRVVLVADLDFMGERARIADLALTLYYTNSTYWEDPTSDDRRRRLRTLVDAYDSGLDHPLTPAERAALPPALARAPLAFIAMIAAVDSEPGARAHAAEMERDVAWALALMRDLPRWRAAFA